MRKTYKNQLPKGMEVGSTKVRIEEGKVFVDVEFKEKFEPKDGDFLVSSKGNVFIYNGTYSCLGYGTYCGIDTCNTIICNCTTPTWTCKQGCRFATPKEKSAFLERLEKECHKRWNAETKQLEDIRWRAEKDCTYYYVDERGNILGCNDTRGCASDSRYLCGNYFKTREAARPYADQIKEIFKNSKAE